MDYSAQSTLKINGYSDSIVELSNQLRHLANEYYRGHINRNQAQSQINKYKGQSWFSSIYLSDSLPSDVSDSKWIYEMDFDPRNAFKNIDIPVLLLYGEYDRWVPIDESIKIWKEIFNQNNNKDFTIVRINNSGHLMIVDEDAKPDQNIFSKNYQKVLQEWILKKI